MGVDIVTIVPMSLFSPLLPMWFAGEYLEVVQNERLVYTESMSDEHGNVSDVGTPAIAVEVKL